MAQTKSAQKELRKTKKRTIQNKAVKANLNYLEKKFLKLVGKDKNEAKKIMTKIQQVLDRATKKNIIKKNTASRKKSRLTKKLTSN